MSNSVAAEIPLELKGESIPGKRWIERPVAVEATIGLLRSIGELGVGVDWSFMPYTAVNLGIGAAMVGPQTSAMFRVRYPWEAHALGVEGGWSGGAYEEPGTGCDAFGGLRESCIRWSYAHCINGAITYEHRSETDFSIRMFLGISRTLNGHDKSMAYGGFALGYAFDIGQRLYRLPPRE